MRLDQIGRYAATLRHLKQSQLWGRLWFRAYRPKPDQRPAPALRTPRRNLLQGSARPPTMDEPASVTFLNEHGDISPASIWNDTSHALLWVYNLHYFDDLTASGSQDRVAWHKALIDRWIAENPPAVGIGWQPYPTSLRIVNWIKWHLNCRQLDDRAVASLAVQVRYLRKRLEFHILGNHLLANAKALYLAGALFEGAEAEGWLALGRTLLEQQIAEQVLPDGAHFELSPMYHLIVLEDLLDVVNFGQAFAVRLPAGIEQAVRKMLAWSKVMQHPDGHIAFFNDATLGIAAQHADLLAFARRLQLEPMANPSPHSTLTGSGYVRLQTQDAVLLADLAAVGPYYLPGHAHADTLSFELSIGKERVLVNSGTSLYGTGPERQRQRGSAAHNVLAIDGQNSSDVWAGFRVGRRAAVSNTALSQVGDTWTLQGTHNGYRHLAGGPMHSRQWVLGDGRLKVTDTVSGSGTHALDCWFHLHPDVAAAQTGTGFTLTLPSGRQLRVELSQDWQVDLVASSWHPGFGLSVPSPALHATRIGSLPAMLETGFQWVSEGH